MKVDTKEYESIYGGKPSGEGQWLLEVTGTDGDGAYTTVTYLVIGKFGDAKNQAAKQLKQEYTKVKKVVEIKVLP